MEEEVILVLHHFLMGILVHYSVVFCRGGITGVSPFGLPVKLIGSPLRNTFPFVVKFGGLNCGIKVALIPVLLEPISFSVVIDK